MATQLRNFQRAALAGALDGRRVLVLADNQQAAHEHFRVMADHLQGLMLPAKVYRTHGRERIIFAGTGRVVFGSLRSSWAGQTVDVIYVPAGTDPAVLAHLQPMLATTGGSVVAYSARVPA